MPNRFATLGRRPRGGDEALQESILGDWLSDVLGIRIPKDFIAFLADGVCLCQLVNRLKPGAVKNIRDVPVRASPFQLAYSTENVNNFLSVLPSLGVPRKNLFSSMDLCRQENVGLVLQCLTALSNLPVCMALAEETKKNGIVSTSEGKRSNGKKPAFKPSGDPFGSDGNISTRDPSMSDDDLDTSSLSNVRSNKRGIFGSLRPSRPPPPRFGSPKSTGASNTVDNRIRSISEPGNESVPLTHHWKSTRKLRKITCSGCSRSAWGKLLRCEVCDVYIHGACMKHLVTKCRKTSRTNQHLSKSFNQWTSFSTFSEPNSPNNSTKERRIRSHVNECERRKKTISRPMKKPTWWLPGLTSVAEATVLLRVMQCAGAFVLHRPDTDQMLLSVLTNGSDISTMRVLEHGAGGVSLGGVRFDSIQALIDHYQVWPVVAGIRLNQSVDVPVAPNRASDIVSIPTAGSEVDEDVIQIREEIQSAQAVAKSAELLATSLRNKPETSRADNLALKRALSTKGEAETKIIFLKRALKTKTSQVTFEDKALFEDAIALLDSQQRHDGKESNETAASINMPNVKPKAGCHIADVREGFAHSYTPREPKRPKDCAACNGYIYWRFLGGYKCTVCGIYSHKECHQKIPDNCLNPADCVSSKAIPKVLKNEPESLPETVLAGLTRLWKVHTKNDTLPYAPFCRLLYQALHITSMTEICERCHVTGAENDSNLYDFGSFVSFYQALFLYTSTVSSLFNRYSRNKKSMTAAEFTSFLKQEQGISSIAAKEIVDELIIKAPKFSDELCLRLATDLKAERCPSHRVLGFGVAIVEECGDLTPAGFVNFLYSDVNDIFNSAENVVDESTMIHPLSHYWINSSHNTYLEGDQLRSPSTCFAYKQVLLSGCRCIELDLWDGRNGKPVIYHGHTLTPKVDALAVVQTIHEFAFVASPYPLILSLECHLSIQQQRVFVTYCNHVFGSSMCVASEGFWESQPVDLPSPIELKGRIIMKCKAHSKRGGEEDEQDVAISDRGKGSASVMKVSRELSDIVVYTKSVPFQNWSHTSTYAPWEMSSFAEKRGTKLARQSPRYFMEYTSRRLCRMYPDGLRFDSSNGDPMILWLCGVQMVSLNFQTPDRPMQLNEGFFRRNGNCGYVLKPPSVMMGTEVTAKNLASLSTTVELTVQLFSGYQLRTPRTIKNRILDPYVVVEILGAQVDCKAHSSVTVLCNSYKPLWDESFTFRITRPEVALLRFRVHDEVVHTIAGQYTANLLSCRTGYRKVSLSIPRPFGTSDLTDSSIFVHLTLTKRS